MLDNIQQFMHGLIIIKKTLYRIGNGLSHLQVICAA